MRPATEIHGEAVAPARIEFEFRVSTGPKGRKRVSPKAAPAADAVPMTTVSPPRPATSLPPTAPTLSRDVLLVSRPAAPARRPVEVIPAATTVLEAAPPETTAAPAETASTPAERIPKLTRLLVLGHYFERLVSDGTVKDYAEIARRTGLTRARVTQITNLTLLAPEIQDLILSIPRIVCDESTVCERALRKILAQPAWPSQPSNWERRSKSVPLYSPP